MQCFERYSVQNITMHMPVPRVPNLVRDSWQYQSSFDYICPSILTHPCYSPTPPVSQPDYGKDHYCVSAVPTRTLRPLVGCAAEASTAVRRISIDSVVFRRKKKVEKPLTTYMYLALPCLGPRDLSWLWFRQRAGRSTHALAHHLHPPLPQIRQGRSLPKIGPKGLGGGGGGSAHLIPEHFTRS